MPHMHQINKKTTNWIHTQKHGRCTWALSTSTYSYSMDLGWAAALSTLSWHFSQLLWCCNIITGQETGHIETIPLINQVIDRHPSHTGDCGMCPQPQTHIHSNPSCQEAYMWHTCWVTPLSLSLSLAERREGKQLHVASHFISNIMCVINLPAQWTCGAVEAIIQHLWQVCGIDRRKMNRGYSRVCASVRVWREIEEGREGRREREMEFQRSVFSLSFEAFFNLISSLYIKNCYHWHPQAVYNRSDCTSVLLLM